MTDKKLPSSLSSLVGMGALGGDIGAQVRAAAERERKGREAAEAYQGKKNIYTCQECFEHIVTVDLDAGVTPFMVGCRCTQGCKGKMQSSMYRVFDQTMKAHWEWYRPTILAGLSHWEIQHLDNGGLLLRKAVAQ